MGDGYGQFDDFDEGRAGECCAEVAAQLYAVACSVWSVRGYAQPAVWQPDDRVGLDVPDLCECCHGQCRQKLPSA